MKVASKWHRLCALSGFERGILFEAFAALPATWVGLRLAGFRRWKFLLTRFTAALPAENLSPVAIDTARIVASIGSAASRNLFFRPSCLEQSMVLWWLLRNRGIPAKLRIGARKSTNGLEAHAWVECGGTVLNEPEEKHLHFATFDGPIDSVETPAH
jgi:Transglutaminase-like superfamily